MRSASVVIWLAAALALAPACGPKKPPPPPVIEDREPNIIWKNKTPETPPATAAGKESAAEPDKNAGGEAPSAGAPPEVKLLEPGSEPRRELRHTFKTGGPQKLAMKSSTKVSGINLPIPTILLDAPMETKIVEVAKNGDAKFKFSAGPFKTSSGGGGGAMGGLLGGLMGGGGPGGGGGAPERVAGTGVITARGHVKEFTVEEGAQDGDAPVERGEPFPEEPVGVGARWQVKSVVTEKEGDVRQTTTYTIVKLDKNSVETKVSRVQVPVSGGGPDAPGAAKSSGELVFRFGEVYPTGRLEMTRAMKLALPGLDASNLKLSSEVRITKR